MARKPHPIINLRLDKIVGGGQALGTLESGKKMLVWGGLPDEVVEAQVTKKKSTLNEGYVTTVIEASPQRVQPKDPESYLSTSPWQIMTPEAEQHYKAALIEEAFELHNIVLPNPIEVYTDNRLYEYRNKIEFSWWWDNDKSQLDLAFFRRGSKGKIPVEGTSLASPEISRVATKLRDTLRARDSQARDLKTVIVRSSESGQATMQLYTTNEEFTPLSNNEIEDLGVAGFELIFSNPKSPASVITKKIQTWGNTTLTDTVLGTPFRYATEGFFQINLPVYEQALIDMKDWVDTSKPTLDLYSGVGSIGLTIGSSDLTLVESNESAVREMKRNITELDRNNEARAILAASEDVVGYISKDSTIIVDPPRAGLHDKVVSRLIDEKPERIIYLSCNPATQARDVMKLGDTYGVRWHKGYNFFPRTPHIEHLVILDLK